MVPSTGLTIIFFLLLVAPGLLFDLLSERWRAGISESAFREASRVVLASFILSSVGLGVVGIIRTFAPSLMPSPRELILHGNAYIGVHYALIIQALAVQSAVAFGLAFLAHLYLSQSHQGPPMRAVSTWHQVLREECPAGYVPYVRLRMSDGHVFFGHVGYYTADLDQSAREIILLPPMFSKSPSNVLQALPAAFQRLALSGSNITTVSVEYRPRPAHWPQPPIGKQPPALLRGLIRKM